MKLISMTAFVFKQAMITVTAKSVKEDFDPVNKLNAINRYAEFLIQPLFLGMFVPTDENGNILEEPERIHFNDGFDYKAELDVYNEAKYKVLFEGFTLDEIGKNQFIVNYSDEDGDERLWIMEDETIEDLLGMNFEFELSKSSIKRIGCEAIA